ncbi:alkaline phosphatase D family protein [Pseudonocardia sp. HH130630-07]|uniref:alkaline phosphatase D family protein n=1 Tax=Pseudonocardia sp. HH130630-07 TaxID=1690815 RepID=UPI0008151959|nr:alkaline phosphatase D family protein [Pseudonocardia sp. HH130630-07]ANY05483.1 alkaline phosphatase [Pseudonocardia sp. HH130630-07]
MVLSRRSLLRATALTLPAAAAATAPGTPGLVRSGRPVLTHGVQAGDVRPGSGLVWTRADRPSRMVVEVAGDPGFRDVVRVPGPVLTPDTDFTGRLRVPATHGRVHYRVTAESLDDGTAGEPLTGSFRAVPGPGEPVRIQWSGDVAGQGWGIDRSHGGMRIFSAMADRNPDLFLHSGDTVYADGPLQESVTLPDGRIWRNEMTPEKAKVAETLAEFRGQFAYNMRDDNLRRFAASVGQIVQWDDHEVTNNWYPGEILTGEVGEKYSEKRVDVLAARGFRAFHEWQPLDPRAAVDGRVYRRLSFGPHVEVFVLDMRSYRSANSANTGAGERILGEAQARWLVDSLADSRASWKIVASDMPIGVLVPDGDTAWEAVANGEPGPPSGRESEIAGVLAGLARRRVRNVVWVTADVHYTAAHHYAPERAAFTEFDPFWEFVSGPLHAGAFGPNELDPTFGPSVEFVRGPSRQEASPLEGFQHFGEIDVAPDGSVLDVHLRDQDGASLWTTTLHRA